MLPQNHHQDPLVTCKMTHHHYQILLVTTKMTRPRTVDAACEAVQARRLPLLLQPKKLLLLLIRSRMAAADKKKAAAGRNLIRELAEAREYQKHLTAVTMS
jgi:hypothetical protein